MRQGNLTSGSITGGLMRLALPMLIAGVLQNAQSMIDLYWVGRLGKVAVAAVAMSGTVLFLLVPLLMGVATGTIALVARAIGAGKVAEAERAAGQSLMLALVLGGLTAIVGLLLSGPLLGLLQTPADVVPDGVAYLRISLLGYASVFVLFIGNSALQGAGDAMTPMWIMATANLLNIGLDPLFIFGLGPLPRMGVAGAAVATVLAQVIAAGLCVRKLYSGKTPLHVRLHHWHPDLGLSWRVLRIGLPGGGQMAARSLMSAVLMSLVAGCGTAAVASYGIGLRFHMIVLMPAFALGGAAATMVGQGLGAGKPARAARAAWLATWMDVAFMAVAAGLLMVFAPQLIGFFNSDADVVRVGTAYLRIVSPFYVFTAFGIVLGRALNGAGDTVVPMFITIVTLWGVQVPLAVLLAHRWEPSTQGIWWAISVAMALNGVLAAAWFQTGRWKTRRV